MPSHSYGFRLTLVTNVAQIIVAPSNKRREVTITCAFGLATVRFSVTSGDLLLRQGFIATAASAWTEFPGAGQFLWTLEEGEGMAALTSVGTNITGYVRELA